MKYDIPVEGIRVCCWLFFWKYG